MAIDSRKVFATNLISDEDYKALDLVVNNSLHLASNDFDLGELLSKVNIELSPKRQCSTCSMNASAISEQLAQLKKQRDLIDKERSKALDRYYKNRDEASGEKSQLLQIELQVISCSIENAEDLLRRSIEGQIYVEEERMGEFISSPNPKVVLYYKNIQDECGLVPVFVHEMFHAWNYFEAGSQDRSVMEIDEAMVEFATLHYLNTLADSLKQSDVESAVLMEKCARWQKRRVENKKTAFGNTTAYGFGLCLADKLSTEAPLWIETYAGKSASLNPDDPKVTEVMSALAPFYPFDKEAKVLKQFKDVIFASVKATSGERPRFTLEDVFLQYLSDCGYPSPK